MWSCSLRKKRTTKRKNKPDKLKPPRAWPVMVGSRRSFLVYVAAILCHKPILAQLLGFISWAASTVEQSAVQRTVSIANLRCSVFVQKPCVTFLTEHQIKLFHLCIRPLFFRVSGTQRTHSTTNAKTALLTLTPKSIRNFQRECALTRDRSVPQECAACIGECRSKGLGVFPNKRFATQNKQMYIRLHCLRTLWRSSTLEIFVWGNFYSDTQNFKIKFIIHAVSFKANFEAGGYFCAKSKQRR